MKYKRLRIRDFIIINYLKIKYFIYNHTWRHILVFMDKRKAKKPEYFDGHYEIYKGEKDE